MVRDRLAFDRGLARGIAAFRWAALAWAWIGLLLQRDDLRRPLLAIAALVAATVVTIAATGVAARRSGPALEPRLVIAELTIGLTVLVLDGVVFDAGREQSLPWAWPAAAIIAAAVLWGTWVGLLSAASMAAASFVGESVLRDSVDWSVSSASKSALYGLAAVATGTVVARLREAEDEISTARAREEIARTLHDGVLQTLAVIQRRSADDELRALARVQERDLRSYLYERDRPPADLGAALRGACDLVAQRHAVDVHAVLADDLPDLPADSARALVGAVQEAATNAAKHSGAQRIVVFAEPSDEDGTVFCSVRDDGCGFDVASVTTGAGLRSSIRGRIDDVGGRVEVDSMLGRGTEVRVWLR
jgi:signal transduction histidine kinase